MIYRVIGLKGFGSGAARLTLKPEEKMVVMQKLLSKMRDLRLEIRKSFAARELELSGPIVRGA